MKYGRKKKRMIKKLKAQRNNERERESGRNGRLFMNLEKQEGIRCQNMSKNIIDHYTE